MDRRGTVRPTLERLVRIAEKTSDRNYEELKKELEENEKHSSRI